MNNSILICGDIHCRDFYKPILNIKGHSIVFLGDYMDPYKFEGTNDVDGIFNLKEIFDFARSNDNVTLLAGNHDCSYIWSPMGYERTNCAKYYDELHALYRDNLDLLQPYALINNILFSHAGISNMWIDAINTGYYTDGEFKLDSKNVLDWIDNEWFNECKRDCAIRRWGYRELESPIFWCGSSRGGDDPAAGPFWRDHDWDDYPLDNFYTQIYGHTRMNDVGLIRCSKTGFCIDSRAIFELDLDTKKLKFSDINEDKVRQNIKHGYCKSI